MNQIFPIAPLAAVIMALAVALPVTGFAGEEEVVLKDAPGREQVMDNCTLCHSVDYVRMNSPFMNKAAWQATTTKMVKVMGAPITPDDLSAIVDYLTKNYGVE